MEKQPKRVSDVIGDGKIDFYSDLPQRDLEDILGKDVMFMDVRIMRDWKSDYGKGTSDWCLIQAQDIATGDNFTTKCGGVVLVKRMAELLGRKCFPIVGSIVMQGGSERPYYNIL
ncbi:hypothetical protein ES703_47522 [subsurface metagenome]